MSPSFADAVRNLNTVKEERTDTRVVAPNDDQVSEQFRLYEEVLAGSGIEQLEIAAIGIDVGDSAAQVILDAPHMTREDLTGVLAGVWVDGVVQAINYVRLRIAEEKRPLDEEAEQRQREFDAQVQMLIEAYPELDEPECAARVARAVLGRDPDRAQDIDFIREVYLELKAGDGE